VLAKADFICIIRIGLIAVNGLGSVWVLGGSIAALVIGVPFAPTLGCDDVGAVAPAAPPGYPDTGDDVSKPPS
jgi:hypothetical protein